MVEVKSRRLQLIPLEPKNLQLLIKNQRLLEKSLGLHSSISVLDDELIGAMKIRLSRALEDEGNYIWYTNWLIVHREQNSIVGGVMIKGKPNEFGEVIIGYYTYPEHQRNGYMTEAIDCLTAWLLKQLNVSSVIADTAKDNIASHKVLIGAGARLYRETEDLYFWKITS
jgi:[ribosomal protein S5]-alanine N-acetyltransferase